MGTKSQIKMRPQRYSVIFLSLIVFGTLWHLLLFMSPKDLLEFFQKECQTTFGFIKLNADEAHWSDTAESGIVSNAFVHSLRHWQTLWNWWNPSLVKLAQTPSVLDLFHFRELCHMLTVIHEAVLAQRGGVLAELVQGWENTGYNNRDIFVTSKPGRQLGILGDTTPEAIRGKHYLCRHYSRSFASYSPVCLTHLASTQCETSEGSTAMMIPPTPTSHTHAHTQTALSSLLSAPGRSPGMFAPPS